MVLSSFSSAAGSVSVRGVSFGSFSAVRICLAASSQKIHGAMPAEPAEKPVQPVLLCHALQHRVGGGQQHILAGRRAAESARPRSQAIAAGIRVLLDIAVLRQRVRQALHDRGADSELSRHLADAERRRRAIEQIKQGDAAFQ
jgi:hypothetical protein